MSGSSHNRLRQLEGLVTIDAWHKRRRDDPLVADLHMYVHFDEARLGGKTQDHLAFRLVMRRAEIRLSQTEPASYRLDPSTIWRGDKPSVGRVTRKSSDRVDDSSKASLEAGFDKVPKLIAKADRNSSHNLQKSTEAETNEAIKPISVSFARIDRNQPVWILRPNGSGHLSGSPWVDTEQRLLELSLKRGLAGQESDILIKIACRREDLHFYDIQVRAQDGRFSPVRHEEPFRVAIEEYLKTCLTGAGLPGADMKSVFSVVVLGEVISEPR